jgi:hypothetical protein
MHETVGIYFAGDDPDDRAFAMKIADAARAFSDVRLLDVDELDRIDLSGRVRPLGFRGTGVYILSPEMLAKEHNRYKLCGATVKLDVPGHTGFYICRGITSQEVRKQYPEMGDLFERVDIGTEGDFKVLLRELRSYVRHPETRLRPSLRLLAETIASRIILLMSVPFTPIAILAPLAVVGMYLLLFFGDPTSASSAYPIVLVSFYGLGWWANRVRPMDLWPFLGRRWRISTDSEAVSGEHSSSDTVPPWGEDVCLSPLTQADSESYCPPDYMRWVRTWWLKAVRRARWSRTIVFALAVVIALVISRKHTGMLSVLSLGAFTFGLVFPVISYWANCYIRRLAYLKIGLRKEEIHRTDEWFDPFKGADSGIALDESTAAGINRVRKTYRFLGQTIGAPTVQRWWFCPQNRVFISYAWGSERDTNTARVLATAIAEIEDTGGLGKDFFLDRLSNPPFSAWRSRLASALVNCTHFLIVLSPAVLKAKTLQREIKTAFQRWNMELFPAIICVLDEFDAKELLAIERLPYEIQFMLSWCPRLTHAEAGDTIILSKLLAQRRRQGLFMDWLSIITPQRCLSRLVSTVRP